MTLDLFSSFDLYLCSFPVGSIFFCSFFFLSASPFFMKNTTFKKIFFFFFKVISSQSPKKSMSPLSFFLFILFLYLIWFNLMGLIPFFYSFTSQLYFSLPLSVGLWSTLLIISFINSPKSSLSTLVPSFSPMWLVFF